MKKRILFVDDEPQVLQGLRRMLHGQTRVWDTPHGLVFGFFFGHGRERQT